MFLQTVPLVFNSAPTGDSDHIIRSRRLIKTEHRSDKFSGSGVRREGFQATGGALPSNRGSSAISVRLATSAAVGRL